MSSTFSSSQSRHDEAQASSSVDILNDVSDDGRDAASDIDVSEELLSSDPLNGDPSQG